MCFFPVTNSVSFTVVRHLKFQLQTTDARLLLSQHCLATKANSNNRNQRREKERETEGQNACLAIQFGHLSDPVPEFLVSALPFCFILRVSGGAPLLKLLDAQRVKILRVLLEPDVSFQQRIFGSFFVEVQFEIVDLCSRIEKQVAQPASATSTEWLFQLRKRQSVPSGSDE